MLSEITDHNYDDWTLLLYGQIELDPMLLMLYTIVHVTQTNAVKTKFQKNTIQIIPQQIRGCPINTTFDVSYEMVHQSYPLKNYKTVYGNFVYEN